MGSSVMGVQVLWVLFIVLGFCYQAQTLSSQKLTCDANDLRALQDFMAGLQTSIDGWEKNPSSNCCKWPGITCNSSSSLGLIAAIDNDHTGRVVKLELGNKRLVGKLSESLGSLDQLRTLNLSRNFLESSIPISLFNLLRLEVLDLSFNDFYGGVPDILNLSSIQVLDISQNNLNGSLPNHICDGGGTKLKILKLAENYFTGDLPLGFSNCASLVHLGAGMNSLTGISEGIFGLRNLSDLIIRENKFSGQLSDGFGNLTNLVRFDISSNEFSSTIPNVFHKLRKLESFIAHSNKFTGNLHESLSNSPTITLLNVRNNSLEGPIKINCSAMVNLTSLYLASNQFSGPIPDNLPSCLRLNNINIARNNFRGEIPESYKDFHSLSSFSLSNSSITNLSSALRILQHCKNLTTMVLSVNFRDEELPADPSIHFEKLKILVIANCGLKGLVPQWLSTSKQLQLLDLSWNNLVGTIPAWFGHFDSLFYLDIANNSFTGAIPKNITGLKSLIEGEISLDQEPYPDFPLFRMRNVSAGGLRYNQVRSLPPTLDLSCNHLSGPIWPEFGNLRKLHALDLKFNNLSGAIPSSLSGMSNLETLDLSHNHLSGTIPPSLVKLSFLSKFSVAYNKLHGVIPSGIQFSTFPNSSFEGNNLCGDLNLPCKTIESHYPSEPTFKKSRRNRVFDDEILIGMAVGICFGFIFGVALFRHASRNCVPFMKLLLRLNLPI